MLKNVKVSLLFMGTNEIVNKMSPIDQTTVSPSVALVIVGKTLVQKKKRKNRRKDSKQYQKRKAEKALRRKRRKKLRGKRQKLILTPKKKDRHTKKPVPANFSLVNNTEEIIGYFKEVGKTFSNREQVAFDLEGVEQLSPDAIALLVAKVNDVNFTRGLNMVGNSPLKTEIKKIFDDSRFLEHVQARYTPPPNENNLLIHQKTQKKVHPEIAKQVGELAVRHTFKDTRKFQPIFKMMIECMANTDNHANLKSEGFYDWWLFIYCDPSTNVTSFSFLDLGVGIFNSNPVNSYKQKFFSAIESVTDLSINNNLKLIPKLFSGEIYTSRTKDKTRGQGLPSLKECAENQHIKNMTIITNNVKVSLPSLATVELSNKFNGTFLYWELHP